MKKIVAVVGSLILLGLLVFPGALYAEVKDPYKIGAVLSITGPNAPLGTPERDTLKMLEEQINQAGGIDGHPLQVIIEDDATDVSSAVRATMKLLEQDKVLALIGSSGTPSTLAMIPIIEKAEVPLMALSAGLQVTDPIKKWVFRTPQTDTLVIHRLLKYLRKVKLEKIAVIYDTNSFGVSGRDQIRKFAPDYGITVVKEEAFKTEDTDMTVQLTKIRGTDAQAVVCWGTNPAPAIIAKNMKQLEISIPLFQSHGIANQKFIELGGEAVNGVIFPAGKLLVARYLPENDPQKTVLLQYLKDFQEKYGRAPDTFGGHAWDALQILALVLKETGSDKYQLRDGIEKINSFIGIGGIFNYSANNHDGLTPDCLVMVKIVDGEWTYLE
jgi:branched-chain amino acid transport system substrate-binding protein